MEAGRIQNNQLFKFWGGSISYHDYFRKIIGICSWVLPAVKNNHRVKKYAEA